MIGDYQYYSVSAVTNDNRQINWGMTESYQKAYDLALSILSIAPELDVYVTLYDETDRVISSVIVKP